MNDRGSMCKFRNAQSAFRNLHVDTVFHTSMRNKQVEFNPYIYTFSKLFPFGYEMSVFKYTTTYVSSWKNGCQNFSYVHRSRKHWEFKYKYNNAKRSIPAHLTFVNDAHLDFQR